MEEIKRVPLESNMPSRKLGVKYLDDNQLTNSFPDWRALLARIEEQRQIAEFAIEKQYRSEEGRFPQTYDNLFAVLGGRGSGKSSVILTLREKMKYPERQDILLPIITPEVISGQECSILGWIMSATESVVRSLEQRIDNLYQRNRSNGSYEQEWSRELDSFFKDCRFKKDNLLRRCYKELFEKSMSVSGGVNTSNYSVEDAVGYRVMQSRRQYKLLQDLNKFWNQLSEMWYNTNLQEIRQGDRAAAPVKPPLIVLMFDDIDLVPERSMELLTTTFQYFTNPNIIIILTASEKILKEVIRLKMFERMVGSESNSLLVDAFPWGHERNKSQERMLDRFETDPIDAMAKEFYDKVIPPSSRYQLHRYRSIAEKGLYAYSSTGQSFWAPRDGEFNSIPIEDFLIRQVDELRLAFPRKRGENGNFLLGGKGRKTFQKAYLMIFGEKSRSIANGCLEIMNTFGRLKKLNVRERELTQEEHEEVLLAVRHLVRALLLSKPILEEYADRVNSFLYSATDRVGNYVDYNFPLQCYQREQREIQEWMMSQGQNDADISSKRLSRMAVDYLGKAQEKIAALMIVMFFAEGIMVTTDCGRMYIHGYRQLNQLLNLDIVIEADGHFHTSNMALFPRHQETCDFLYSSPMVLEHISRYVGIDQFDAQYVRNYLEDIFHVRLSQEKAKTILNQAIAKDQEWVKTVLYMMAVRYSGITFVEPAFILFSDKVQKRLELFSFTARFSEKKRLAAQAFLAQNDLITASKAKMAEFVELTKETHRWEDIKERTKAPFFQTRHEIIPLEVRDDEYIEFVDKHDREQRYIRAYFSRRWMEYHNDESDILTMIIEDGNFNAGYCYRLVRFVDDTLAACVATISNQTDIYLTSEQIKMIRVLISRINDFNFELKRKKDASIAAINRASSNSPVLYVDERTDSGQIKLDISGKDPETEPIWQIAAAPLIDYLAGLQGVLMKGVSELADYDYFERSNLDDYFNLLTFLAVVYHIPEKEIQIGNMSMPGSSVLISDLHMVEFLFPYYFAAHMGVVVDSRYQEELLPHVYSQTDSIDKELKQLYNQLTGGKPNRERNSMLCELMQEAQRDLAQDYYNHLEDAHE